VHGADEDDDDENDNDGAEIHQHGTQCGVALCSYYQGPVVGCVLCFALGSFSPSPSA